jgi:hypothetical protein
MAAPALPERGGLAGASAPERPRQELCRRTARKTNQVSTILAKLKTIKIKSNMGVYFINSLTLTGYSQFYPINA